MQSFNNTCTVKVLLIAMLVLAPTLATAQTQQYGSDYIIVVPGMTLTKIMREYYPQHRRHWPALMDEVIRINPHAFVNGAPASLKRGMRLTLPKEVPTTRTTRQSTGDTTTLTTRQSTTPVQPTISAPAVSPGSNTAARQQPATGQQPAAARQQPAQQPIQGATRITVQEPVAALPPPILADTGDDDEGVVGEPEIVAQEAPAGGPSERPPWWWIISALAMVALVL